MDTLQFVSMAVSKDTTRPALTGVYRDTDGHLVATDGHRLHYANGMDKLDKGFYLDGRNEQFPNWQHIIPKEQSAFSITLTVDKEALTLLKALRNLIATVNKSCCPGEMTIKGDQLSIKVKGPSVSGEVLLFIADTIPVVPDNYRLGIKLNYLLDAFTAAGSFKYMQENLTLHFPKKHLFPLQFEIPTLGKGIIMPFKLENYLSN